MGLESEAANDGVVRSRACSSERQKGSDRPGSVIDVHLEYEGGFCDAFIELPDDGKSGPPVTAPGASRPMPPNS